MKCNHCYKYSWILYKYIYHDHQRKKKLLCKKCIKIAMTHNYQIIVELKGPGDFGFVHMSGIYRSPWEEKNLAEEIANQIKRHVDNVGSVQIIHENCTAKEFWDYQK
jgi:hypothetical protein